MNLTKQGAKRLLIEIASACEEAYRRGAQHAIANNLTELDAAWFRLYGTKKGLYVRAHRMPMLGVVKDGRNMSARYYARNAGTSAVDRLTWEIDDNQPLLQALIRECEK